MNQPVSDPRASRRPRVAVVFGGRSSEHAISCATAGSVIAAIDPTRYDVIPIGITRDGRWVLENGDAQHLQIGPSGQLPAVDETRPTVQLTEGRIVSSALVSAPSDVPRELGEVDVVFPVLHGPYGEDGTLQGLLEMAGVRYVGAGVLASAVGMDKHYMKVVLRSVGLPVLPHVLVTPTGWESDREVCREAIRALGFPVFVKPCRGGSSVGISKVYDVAGLDEAIEAARLHDPRVLVEAYAGRGSRELECGVIGSERGKRPEVSVVAEIRIDGDHEFYDFAAKYLPGESTTLVVPADIDGALSDELRELALRTFEAVGCEGLARIDFFVQHGGRAVVNELNTMPGFTPTSMFPLVWKESGIDYQALVERLIELALSRDAGLR